MNAKPLAANLSSETTAVSLKLPARLECLPVLGAAVREYCAALQTFFSRAGKPSTSELRRERRQRWQANGSVSYSNVVYSIELMLQEAATNIIRHGYTASDLTAFIELNLSTLETQDNDPSQLALLLELSDDAQAFDPTAVTVATPDPTELQEGGYGLFLIHKLADKLEYARLAGRNHLRITKLLAQ